MPREEPVTMQVGMVVTVIDWVEVDGRLWSLKVCLSCEEES